MSQSTLTQFNTVLVTGGGGGLGKTMAKFLIGQGKKVLIAGRTESSLKETAQEIGAAGYYVLDTGDTASISPFVQKLVSDHPELDGLINNAGVQRPLSVTDMNPDEFLEKADQEISINIKGPMHLALKLLPHFKQKKSAVIINVSSVLGYLPSSIINPVYNGTKAWLHFFSMNLRTQLEGTSVQVVEIVPPTVATNLHRERQNPNDNKKENNPNALSVEEFMDDVARGWNNGVETIGAGTGEQVVATWYGAFGDDYKKAADSFKA